MTGPGHSGPDGGGLMVYPARVYTYGFDAAGRVVSMTDDQGRVHASAMQYNAAGQLTSAQRRIAHAQNQTGRDVQYNPAGQMARQTLNGWATLAVDFESRFAGANDSRLWQRKDWVTGEEASYSYDALGRLSTAAVPAWSQCHPQPSSNAESNWGILRAKTVNPGQALTLFGTRIYQPHPVEHIKLCQQAARKGLMPQQGIPETTVLSVRINT